MLRKVILIICVVILSSCGRNNDTTEIISLTDDVQTTELSLNDFYVNDLKPDFKHPVGSIKKFMSHDDRYLLYTHGNFLIFGKSGDLLGQIGRVGRAEHEYLDIEDFWIDDSQIYCYDLNSKKILIYDLNGIFIRNINLLNNSDEHIPFHYILPIGENYVGKCIWNGSKGVSPAIAFYDSDFSMIKSVSELTIKSGLRLGYPLVQSYADESVLYWHPLGRDIFRISPDMTVEKAYTIDFGESRNYPALTDIDEYDILDMLNDTDWATSHAGMVTYILENRDFLCFIYSSKGAANIGLYDKYRKIIHNYMLNKSADMLIVSCHFSKANLSLLIEVDDIYKLYQIPLDVLYD